jgi:hypothetical protein
MKWSEYNLDDQRTKALFAAVDKGPGAQLDLDATSFSKDYNVSKKFSSAGSPAYKKTMVITAKDTRGVDIQYIGSGFQREAEFISGGRYKIVSVKTTGNFYDVVVQQIGWFG